MTRSQKITFVGLALILVVFLVLLVHGHGQPDCQGSGCDGRGFKPPAAMKSLGSLLGGGSASVKLAQPSYSIAPGGTVQAQVPAADKSVRTLKLQLKQGQGVELRYIDNDPHPDPLEREQSASLPRNADDGGDARGTAFSVTKQGGIVSMRCTGGQRCEVAVGS